MDPVETLRWLEVRGVVCATGNLQSDLVRFRETATRRLACERMRRVFFRCPFHRQCVKKRVVSDASTRSCGDIEPYAYLHVWRDIPEASYKNGKHTLSMPPDEAVIAFAAANADALRELHAKLCP